MRTNLSEYFNYNQADVFISDLINRINEEDYHDFVSYLNELYLEIREMAYSTQALIWLSNCLDDFSERALPILDFNFSSLARELARFNVAIQHKYLREEDLHLFYTVGLNYAYSLPELFIVGKNKTFCFSLLKSFITKSEELCAKGLMLDLDDKNILKLRDRLTITTILRKVDKELIWRTIKGFSWLYPETYFPEWTGYQIIYSNGKGEFPWDNPELKKHFTPLYKQLTFSLD
jgi:hypothetical protein